MIQTMLNARIGLFASVALLTFPLNAEAAGVDAQAAAQRNDAIPGQIAGAPALDPALEVSTIRLWDGPAPGALGASAADIPTLTAFPPQHGKGNGTAVMVAPGGGYLGLASNLEGRQVADWFAARGVTAFVLKYRLGERYLYPVPLTDALRAVRLVRFLAGRYQIAPDRIGMAGFSAGGHLSAMAATAFTAGQPDSADPVERLSSRPDFLVLGYPWLNAMQPARPGYIPSYQTLMKMPAERHKDLEAPYTPALHVTSATPPAFIFITSDDGTVPVEASVEFYSALKKAGVQAEMHIFRHGVHGVGLGAGDAALDLWPLLLEEWMRGQGLLNPAPVVPR
jgi:acetyl esterase/lipase